jgi:hypothetical protein
VDATLDYLGARASWAVIGFDPDIERLYSQYPPSLIDHVLRIRAQLEGGAEADSRGDAFIASQELTCPYCGGLAPLNTETCPLCDAPMKEEDELVDSGE